jgi:hypothetical protein
MVLRNQTNRYEQVIKDFLFALNIYIYDFKIFNLRSRAEIKSELDDLIKHMIAEFYQPEKNNLKSRTT